MEQPRTLTPQDNLSKTYAEHISLASRPHSGQESRLYWNGVGNDMTRPFSTKHDEYKRVEAEFLRLIEMDYHGIFTSENNENAHPVSSNNTPVISQPEVARRDSFRGPSPQKSVQIPQRDEELDEVIVDKLMLNREKMRRAEDWAMASERADGHGKKREERLEKHSKRPRSKATKSTSRVTDEILTDLYQIRQDYKRGLSMESEALKNIGRAYLESRLASRQSRPVYSDVPIISPRSSDDYYTIPSRRPISEPVLKDYKYKRASELERELKHYQHVLSALPRPASTLPPLRYRY
ncbi:unnamed protein product [Bursaphelenchus xylophilus]|uniref:(pine wood nematode) hypothetical protein n=1 Tax=Bursaphelenchus xylophilus TaxID=6326 RepID=A0A1I7S622_BURXY|nr:unnamed protein product [Bursaphelenchus xylophilus]CAG9082362.1 unnamed protein product [Bursaphelenchus xylophilus]